MCLLIGLPVAYFAAFKVSEKWKTIILALVVIPSFTSFLIRTVAWRIPLAPNGEFSRWLSDLGLVGERGIQLLETQTAVQIAIVYNYLGFMILPLFVALDRIDVRMREASKDLGAGRLATFFGVTLPLAGPGIVAGVLLTFIPMCGDYVTATDDWCSAGGTRDRCCHRVDVPVVGSCATAADSICASRHPSTNNGQRTPACARSGPPDGRHEMVDGHLGRARHALHVHSDSLGVPTLVQRRFVVLDLVGPHQH